VITLRQLSSLVIGRQGVYQTLSGLFAFGKRNHLLGEDYVPERTEDSNAYILPENC